MAVLFGILLIFGSAFFDRLTFDPSAIFFSKPWRATRPSAGDTYRFVFLSLVLACLVVVALIPLGTAITPAIYEAAAIVFVLVMIDGLKYRVAQVRWHGVMVDIRSRLGRHSSVRWTEFVSVKRDWFGDYLEFRTIDGKKFRVCRYLRGYSEFVRDAERYCSPTVQSALRAVK